MHYRWWRLRLVIILLVGTLGFTSMANSLGSGNSTWTNPTNKALQRLGPASKVISQPVLESNLDCTTLTYRFIDETTMNTGCFMRASYGLFDTGSSNIIFNGTDEAVKLYGYTSTQVLTPWPGTNYTLAFSATNTGGSYVWLYKNILPLLRDKKAANGKLVGKTVSQPPDIVLRDLTGARLVINLQTLAFSDDGLWLVAESQSGSFIRIELEGFKILPFATAFGSLGSPALLDSQVAVSGNGRYVAIQNNIASSFKVYDLSSCPPETNSMTPLTCDSFEYFPFMHTNGINYIGHVRFISENLLSFNGSTGGNTDIFELAPQSSIGSLIKYLALGDSFTSGEGAFDYQAGTDTDINHCHLSANSYPLLITYKLWQASSGRSIACSGARIQDISPGNIKDYRGQTVGGTPRRQKQLGSVEQYLSDFSPGYIAQEEFIARYQPEIITISIGGNDVGFGDIVRSCVEPKLGNNTCYKTYEDRLEILQAIDRTISRWIDLYIRIAEMSPQSHIYAIGYPQLLASDGNCGLNVLLDQDEINFASGLITYIDEAMKQAAVTAGINFIDVSQAFIGHRLCETTDDKVAVNGLTAGNDTAGILGKESYHPNALGHSLLKNTILAQTSNLNIKPAIASKIQSSHLLDAPKSGREVTSLSWGQYTNQPVKKSAEMAFELDCLEYGLLPGNPYTLKLDGLALKQLTCSEQNEMEGNFIVPTDTSIGTQIMDLVGLNQLGKEIDIRQAVDVANNDASLPNNSVTTTTSSPRNLQVDISKIAAATYPSYNMQETLRKLVLSSGTCLMVTSIALMGGVLIYKSRKVR